MFPGLTGSMKVGLPGVFMYLGAAVAGILLCFHVYLHERRGAGQVEREGEREVGEVQKRWGEVEGNLMLAGAAPVIPSIMGRVIQWGASEVAVRGLKSVSNETVLSNSSFETGGGMATDQSVNQGSYEPPAPSLSEGAAPPSPAVADRLPQPQPTEGEPRTESEGTPALVAVKTSLKNQTDWFALRSPFSLPTPLATLPLPQLLQCDWMAELKNYLSTVQPSLPVTIVSSDFKYREVLLNWLITAEVKVHKPLSNILVLSLDSYLHRLLWSRNISCVYIPPSCLLQPSLKLERHVAFTQVHIMRLLVMRLLNHWGFDVANYDSDALILRNPESRFAQFPDRHMIGSVGHFPKLTDHMWGTAVCIGVVLFRAAPQTELYWEEMSKVIPENTNDQARMNFALQAMDMQWDNPHMTMIAQVMTGQGRAGFRAAVLPVRDVCRQTCVKKIINMYYVWHKGGSQNKEGKMSYASKGGLWYLRSDWQKVSRSRGVQWLREIAVD